MRRRLEEIAVYNFPRHGGGMVLPALSHVWYVDTVLGRDGRDGRDHRHPLATVEAAITRAGQAQVPSTGLPETGQVIYVRGEVTEQVIVPANLTGLRIIGLDGATWAGPMSPTAATALLDLWATNCHVEGFRFDPESDYYAIRLSASGDDTVGADASYATIVRNEFGAGLGHIVDAGGNIYVTIQENRFVGATQASIELIDIDISASPALVQTPLRWKIIGNTFGLGNASHILASMIEGVIAHNQFMTVVATAAYIDLLNNSTTDEASNIVGPGNVFAGAYAHADYQDVASDVWAGNYLLGGLTTANPAA